MTGELVCEFNAACGLFDTTPSVTPLSQKKHLLPISCRNKEERKIDHAGVMCGEEQWFPHAERTSYTVQTVHCLRHASVICPVMLASLLFMVCLSCSW